MEEMMFITSHKVRLPVANILGITSIIGGFLDAPVQLRKMIIYLKRSATSLDEFIQELTEFINDKEEKRRIS
jgi:hypothetical protein